MAVAASTEKKGERRGILDDAGGRLQSVAVVTSESLAKNLKAFSEQFGKALAAVDKVEGGFDLDEIKVSVELGVEGEITVLGVGASASGKAGLEMVFKRRPTAG